MTKSSKPRIVHGIRDICVCEIGGKGVPRHSVREVLVLLSMS
jgi:hypothetical protein